MYLSQTPAEATSTTDKNIAAPVAVSFANSKTLLPVLGIGAALLLMSRRGRRR